VPASSSPLAYRLEQSRGDPETYFPELVCTLLMLRPKRLTEKQRLRNVERLLWVDASSLVGQLFSQSLQAMLQCLRAVVLQAAGAAPQHRI